MTPVLPGPSRQFYNSGLLVLFALTSFVLQVLLFTTEFRPDEWRSLSQFLAQIAGRPGPAAEVWTRVVLTAFNLALVGGLCALRLINRDTLILALIWPLTLFLFSKIYWEFFVFPLCLVRFDLSRRQEMGFIAFLSALIWITAEANLAVILCWRGVLLLQKSGMRWSAPIILISTAIVLDMLMQSGAAGRVPLIGEHLARFSWTRNIVNPEYSVLETLAVLAASFHFFSLHDGAYWIDAGFSVLVLLVLMNSRDFWSILRQHLDVIAALLAVIFLFTAVTHAFQNARYYFFFLPVLAALTPRHVLPMFAALGLLHVLVRGLSL